MRKKESMRQKEKENERENETKRERERERKKKGRDREKKTQAKRKKELDTCKARVPQLVYYNIEQIIPMKYDHIKRLITLTVITLSTFHCAVKAS
jgi:hypothetical protein